MWRKLVSLILRQRKYGKLDDQINRRQPNWSRNKSISDVVIPHRLSFAASVGRQFNRVLTGIDMLKAFNFVRWSTLTELLGEIIYPEDLKGSKILCSTRVFAVKKNKLISERNQTKQGVNRGGATLPNFFNFENESPTTIDNLAHRQRSSLLWNKIQSVLASNILSTLTSWEQIDRNPLMVKVDNTFKTFDMSFSHDKWDITYFENDASLRKVKKLLSLLDNSVDTERRDNLCQVAPENYYILWFDILYLLHYLTHWNQWKQSVVWKQCFLF